MGEIIGELIIFTFLNFIGGAIRWFFASLWKLVFNRPKRPFKEYIYDSDNDSLTYDGAHGCLNIVLGIVFIVLVVIIISNI